MDEILDISESFTSSFKLLVSYADYIIGVYEHSQGGPTNRKSSKWPGGSWDAARQSCASLLDWVRSACFRLL